MCTGGDDGLVYFQDLRLCDDKDDCTSHNDDDNSSSSSSNTKNHNKCTNYYTSSVIAKVQFDAGVVSLAPVVE